MRDRVRIEIAYHEAGHAIVAAVRGFHVQRATIKPSDDRLGIVEVSESKHVTPLDWCMFYLGGLAGTAQLGLPNSAHQAFSRDHEQIDALLRQHHGRVLHNRIESPLYCRALIATHTLCNRLHVPIAIVAKLLIAHETLGHADVARTLNNTH